MKKPFNNNQKILLFGIASVFVMFLLYQLFLSPYAQCVDGYKKRYGSGEIGTPNAKVFCGSQRR